MSLTSSLGFINNMLCWLSAIKVIGQELDDHSSNTAWFRTASSSLPKWSPRQNKNDPQAPSKDPTTWKCPRIMNTKKNTFHILESSHPLKTAIKHHVPSAMLSIDHLKLYMVDPGRSLLFPSSFSLKHLQRSQVMCPKSDRWLGLVCKLWSSCLQSPCL